ncbi:MAG TPA: hypothetical protein VFP87_14050 [Chitinophagaceae bacterium]|nr:hypothetical protein [Chitinophagaceae bacterium]
MYETLYKFLVRYGTLRLPDIGTIILRVKPAESQFVDQRFLPPKYSFVFEPARAMAAADYDAQVPGDYVKASPSKKMYSWVASQYGITEREAVIRLSDFVFELMAALDAGKKISWNGIGIFHKDETGQIIFDDHNAQLAWLEPTIAKKVIRDNAEHTMLVGEREKTSVEMTEMLMRPRLVKERRGYWWVWPLAVIIAIFIFLGWYFSEHGISGAATGNNHKATPAEAPASN